LFTKQDFADESSRIKFDASSVNARRNGYRGTSVRSHGMDCAEPIRIAWILIATDGSSCCSLSLAAHRQARGKPTRRHFDKSMDRSRDPTATRRSLPLSALNCKLMRLDNSPWQ
jgi:hypothetical protein